MKKKNRLKQFIATCKCQGIKVALTKSLIAIFNVKGYSFVKNNDIQNAKPKMISVVKPDKSYRLPDILTNGICPKRYEIAACAFRPQTAKGGPGAVLYTMKDIMGAQMMA